MKPLRDKRLPWEYTDGPTVGEDVPITSPPRPEEKPGIPKLPPPQRDGDHDAPPGGASCSEPDVREVRAEDPSLSAETNERLTSELREVVGTDRVRVPKDRPRATRGEHPQQRGAAAYLEQNRMQLVRTTAIMLTFGAIVALATRNWWVLPIAAAVHALGTMAVALSTIRLTTISERPSPQVAAAMSEEGVRNPDEHFSRMVEEFREDPERGTTEVLSPGFNERTVPADATAAAAAEQSAAMTPTSQPSRSGGVGGAPNALIWGTVVSLFVLSIVLPAAMGGGWLWLLTAVMVPLLVGWGLIQWLMIARPERARMQGRRPIVAIVICTAVAVAAFCAVIAFAFQH